MYLNFHLELRNIKYPSTRGTCVFTLFLPPLKTVCVKYMTTANRRIIPRRPDIS